MNQLIIAYENKGEFKSVLYRIRNSLLIRMFTMHISYGETNNLVSEYAHICEFFKAKKTDFVIGTFNLQRFIHTHPYQIL